MNAEVTQRLERARRAQQQYETYDQQQVDQVVTALAWSVVNPDNNQCLSEMAVADTGLGRVADKIVKNRRKTIGLLRDLRGAKSVGVIAEYPQKGLIEIARPVGVVGAIVPSTNPVATPTNKTLNALKGRNAIILAPSPKGDATCARLLEYMRVELKRVGAPLDLVQKLPSPINKADTQQLMQAADLIVATGSQNNVRNAYASGTPAIGVGVGNVVSIIDETADEVDAARKIVISKSFDNATSCSSENNLIIVKSKYPQTLEALCQHGAQRLDAADTQLLARMMWQEGKLNPALTAKSAAEIVQRAKLQASVDAPRILLVEQQADAIGTPFSGEKLSPVLSIYPAEDFAQACVLAAGILDYQGKGHSISIHTQVPARATQIGLQLPVCRVIVNQIHCYATGGNFDNGLPFSLSMGCGSWGRNSISDNLNYRHYLNTTRVVHPIAADEPTEQQLFADYWQRFDCHP